MSDEFIAFRLNPKKDAAIISDLRKYKNKSKRIKDIYRDILAAEDPYEVKPAVLIWDLPKNSI